MLNGAGCWWILFERPNLAFSIVRHFFGSGVRWPQFWMSGRSIILAPFSRKSLLSHFFHHSPESRFLSRKYRSKKSPVAANANRCRLAVSIELYLSVMKWRENRSGRNEEGEGRVSSLSRLSQPWPQRFFFLLTFLWAFQRLHGAVVCDPQE